MLISIKLHSNKYFISSQDGLTVRFKDYYNLKLHAIIITSQTHRATETKRNNE